MKKGYIHNLEFTRKYINDEERLRKVIEELVNNRTFKDTQTPFAVVATDLVKGEKVILT